MFCTDRNDLENIGYGRVQVSVGLVAPSLLASLASSR